MMRRDRGTAIVRLLEDLGDGDPLAWGFVLFFVLLGLGLGLFVLKIRRDHRLEDEKRARRYGRSA